MRSRGNRRPRATRCAVVALLFYAAMLGMNPVGMLRAEESLSRRDQPGDANRLTYLDAFLDPYYVSGSFPKLTTPQWVGDRGVEAVVVLAIDDMRDSGKYEAYLRPILDRLKQIDGRAAVSIMTNRAEPDDPQLARWLDEGVSIEVHTYDHPCPLLQKSDFEQARRTYDTCVDLMARIPGNRPVAFRMPCCDSLNTPSPRFWTEIFNRTTERGHFLSIDSSVFNVTTPADRSLPADWVLLDGQERFRRYIPFPSFVNTIENYPYPYLIGRQCWEFPCAVPSDWEAQHLQRPNNPDTVRDMKIAIDITVRKQGVYNLVFHPHNWIRSDQIVQLIDHAREAHGEKVKFLTFREAAERLQEHLLAGQPLRAADGGENGVRLIDLNADGYLDVVIANDQLRLSRVWSPEEQSWRDQPFPADVRGGAVRFGVIDGDVVALRATPDAREAWRFDPRNGWVDDPRLLEGLRIGDQPVLTRNEAGDRGLRLRDVNHDGRCELLVSNQRQSAVFQWNGERWSKASFDPPDGVTLVDERGEDAGLRFVDVDEDGFDDVMFSDEKGYSLHLWNSRDASGGWTLRALRADRSDKGEIPMIVRQGTNNGAWFHSRHMWVQNEDTARLPDLVDRRSFAELVRDVHGDQPPPKSLDQSLRSFELPPDVQLELVVAEPLVNDPVAFDWSPDGTLWVAEMGDYPRGIDGQGRPGGRIKRIADRDGDGQYDHADVFLDKVPFPTGVKVWRDGILVSTAPNVFFAADTDRDGVADTRRVLFEGFVEGNQQHRVNGLRWGLDNWLYLANGDSGGVIRSTATGRTLDIRGRDLRIRPDTGEMDAVAGQTQFGRNRDDWGNWFGGNNSNPMWHYVLEDYVTRRNPHYPTPQVRQPVSEQPGAAPVYPLSRTLTRFNDFDRANRFTSACSPIVYRDQALGSNYAGNAFVAEPVHNLVHREILSASDATFTSRRPDGERESEFLRGSDNWFRPTMIRTGPDGALWVADMYRLVIEHPKWIPEEWQRRLELREGHDRGRIYRITSRRAAAAPPASPPLAASDLGGLVAALESGNGWVRDMAHQMLIWRDDTEAVAPLERLAAESPEPLARLHALCVLDHFGPLKDDVVLPRLSDDHPGVRRHAVRLVGLHPPAGGRVLEKLAAMVADEREPRVQIELAVALGELDDPAAAAALGRLAAQVYRQPYRFAAVMSSLNEKNLPRVLESALAEADAARDPQLVQPLLTMAAAVGRRETLNDLLLAWMDGERSLTSRAATIATVLETARGSEIAFSDAMRSRLDRLIDEARQTLEQPEVKTGERVALARLLAFDRTHRQASLDALLPLLSARQAPEVQQAAASAAVRLAGDDAPSLVVTRWQSFSPALRQHLLDLLLARPEQTRKLLTAVKAQSEAGDNNSAATLAMFDARRRQQLRQHADGRIAELARQLFERGTTADRGAVIRSYETALRGGDAERGRQVFVKNCANCHRLRDVGHEVGPDLAALTNRTPAALLEAILDPNRAIESKYLDYVALTEDGRQFSGILTSETSSDITLSGQQAKRQVILRKELEQLRSTGRSLMPVGLEKEIDAPAMADLIAFLGATGPAPKSFPENQPRTVSPDDDGSILLRPASARIYGPQVVMEPKYGNLGYWGHADDRAVWSLEVPAGRYTVELEYACPADTAHNTFQVQLLTAGSSRPHTFKGRPQATKSWDEYRTTAIGEVDLPEGAAELTVRSEGAVRGYLFDLRGVVLKPAGKK